MGEYTDDTEASNAEAKAELKAYKTYLEEMSTEVIETAKLNASRMFAAQCFRKVQPRCGVDADRGADDIQGIRRSERTWQKWRLCRNRSGMPNWSSHVSEPHIPQTL